MVTEKRKTIDSTYDNMIKLIVLLRHSCANYNIININITRSFCVIATQGVIIHQYLSLESTLQDFIFLFFFSLLGLQSHTLFFHNFLLLTIC